MKSTILAAALTALTATSAFAEPAGYVPLSIDAPHHGRNVTGALWYPSSGDGSPITFGENGVFHGITVLEEPAVKPGTYPVVLISHGLGGNIRSLAWLASGLAERGAVVVSVNHPNSTWGDFDLALGLRHWTRVQDLSVALDALLVDPRVKDHLDTSRIMAAGFSYGGWTALSMSGVRGRFEGYIGHCKEYGAASAHCDVVLGGEDMLAHVDGPSWNASYADERITHAVAVDPGLIWGLEAEDVGALIDQVSVIGLGTAETRMLATDFDASGLTELLPDVRFERIAPAMHFSALPLCKPQGEAILIEEKDDPVCTDPEGTDRDAVHTAIVERMATDLGL